MQYNANRKELLLIFSIFIIGLPKLAFFAVKAVLQFIQLFSILICCGSQCTHFLVQVFKQLLYGTGNKRSRKDQINKSSDSGLFEVPYSHLRSFGSSAYYYKLPSGWSGFQERCRGRHPGVNHWGERLEKMGRLYIITSSQLISDELVAPVLQMSDWLSVNMF